MSNKKGFTLVELLIVIVIIGILFSIIMARVPEALIRAREGKTKDYLANLRVAINNYYSTNQGFYPPDLDDKPNTINGHVLPPFIPGYMLRIPKATLRPYLGPNKHGQEISSNSNKVTVINTGTRMMTAEDIEESNIGGWIYSSTTGEIRVNCNKLDSKGKIYYSDYGYVQE